MATPPAGAGSASVTVARAGEPPVTLSGEKARPVTRAPVTTRVPLRVTPRQMAVIVTARVPLAGAVTTGKSILFIPGGTVTVAGTVARVLSLLVSVMAL